MSSDQAEEVSVTGRLRQTGIEVTDRGGAYSGVCGLLHVSGTRAVDLTNC